MNINSFGDVVVLGMVTGLVLMFPLNFFLSIKLRKNKQIIMNHIISGVPERLQLRISFGMNAHMSWIAAAYVIYIWFSYLLFRYGQHVTQAEFKTWHLATKQAFGGYFYLGLISAIGGNLFTLCFLLFIPLS